VHHWDVTSDRHRSAITAGPAARLLAILMALAVAAAACGNATPSRPPNSGPDSTAPATATATPAASTPAPVESIVPIPSAQLEAAPAPAVKLDANTAAALQRAIDAVRTRGKIPGLSVAIVFPDGSMWSGQSGVGVVATKAKIGPDTLFSVGSITKTFTGALALRLAERGTISLDDPLSKYLPKYTNASRITLRELMNHTSGIRDIFEPAIFKYFDANHNTRWTPDKVLAVVGKPYFTPGANYHYSSTNYIVLGQVLEKATGQSLAALVRTEFLTPLGLDHTYLQWEENPKGTLAHGYVGSPSSPRDISNGQSLIPYVSEATAVGAGGGVVSTAQDIARWGTALYDGALFDEATTASMTDVSATLAHKPKTPYGLSFEQLTIGKKLVWGHRGHLDGFWSTMAYFPDSQLTVALLTNADWPDPLAAIASIVAAIPPAA
jgi:D-alanyl-D-alanine carboxypeptidase